MAKDFTDEHRAALDWLNQITEESIRFFGLEIQLWQIGDSPPAPKFNIVSKPNEWSKSVAQETRSHPSEAQLRSKKYWDAFHRVLDKAEDSVSGDRKPQPQSWMGYAVGRTGFSLVVEMTRRENKISVGLYIGRTDAKAFFRLLEQQKDGIEQELGYQMGWKFPAQGGRDCRIMAYLEGADPDDEDDWMRQHEWLAERLNEMHDVFAPRIKELNTDDWPAGSE